MDVRLSAEQVALRTAVAQLVDRHGPRSVRDLDDRERADKLDAALQGTGWRELRTADDGGAPLASGVEVALVAEQLGRGLADAPYLGPTLAAELRRLAGAPPANRSETVLFTGNLRELASESRQDAVAVDAAGAAAALFLDGTTDGYALVGIGLAGATARADLTRPAADVSGGEVMTVAGADHPLSDDDRLRWTALGLSLACADLVGIMSGALQLGCDYAKTRQQYDVAIGSFQAVQHLLADAHVATEGSRSVALHAAWAVDALPPAEALAAAALAKAYCARASRQVCETVIQVHGGIGNTWECLAHVFLRRALLSADLLGGVGPSLEQVWRHGLR